MLNEIKEFEQYTRPDFTPKSPDIRLKYKPLIANGFSGIERAMIVIARHFLFDDSGKVLDERADNALRLWCGEKAASLDEETEALRDWLPNYIRNVFLADKVKACTVRGVYDRTEASDPQPDGVIGAKNAVEVLPEDLISAAEEVGKAESAEEAVDKASSLPELLQEHLANLSGAHAKALLNAYYNRIAPIVNCTNALNTLKESKRKLYAKSMFQEGFSDEETDSYSNDSKAITYDSVIAKGFRQGPLKRYYLCCSDKAVIDAVAGKSERKRDLLLKTTAAWLLGREHENRGQDHVWVNKTDIINWSKDISKHEDYHPEVFRDENKNQLFHFELVGKNTVKLFIGVEPSPESGKGGRPADPKAFINNFTLIEHEPADEKNDLSEESKTTKLALWKKRHPNGVYFRDDGSGEYLRENLKYEGSR